MEALTILFLPQEDVLVKKYFFLMSLVLLPYPLSGSHTRRGRLLFSQLPVYSIPIHRVETLFQELQAYNTESLITQTLAVFYSGGFTGKRQTPLPLSAPHGARVSLQEKQVLIRLQVPGNRPRMLPCVKGEH